MAGFIFKKNQLGLPTPELEAVTIAASVTMHWGGWARIVIASNPTANNGAVCEDVAAGEATLFGIVQGFVTNNGEVLETADSSAFDGTFTDGVFGAKSYLSSSDNLTDKQVRALIRPATYADVWRSTPDATIRTTAGSGTRFNYTDLADDVTVDENNAAAAVTTVAQLLIWGVDPVVTTDGLYKGKELQDEIG